MAFRHLAPVGLCTKSILSDLCFVLLAFIGMLVLAIVPVVGIKVGKFLVATIVEKFAKKRHHN